MPPRIGTRPFPCPGLSRTDPCIDRYLGRTAVSGGGAPSRLRIAAELFNMEGHNWNEPSSSQQRMAFRREEVLQAWKNSRSNGAVYSSQCEEEVYSDPTTDPKPYYQCSSLFNLHSFQVALNRQGPLEENMKYVPKSYRCPELGQLYLKYKGFRELMKAPKSALIVIYIL